MFFLRPQFAASASYVKSGYQSVLWALCVANEQYATCPAHGLRYFGLASLHEFCFILQELAFRAALWSILSLVAKGVPVGLERPIRA
jgi:hypothetical protein